MADRPTIVQCAREIRPGGGVCGVADALERAFERRGYRCERFTMEQLRLRPYVPTGPMYRQKLHQLRDVVAYSTLGSAMLVPRQRSADHVVLVHNDAMVGDVFVNHGLHKRVVFEHPQPWRMLARNPLHAFLLAREELRHRARLYRKLVSFSEGDRGDLKRFFPIADADIVTIPNGVDVEKFSVDPAARERTRRELGVGDAFVVLFVGHEFERKGLARAIASLRHLPARVVLYVAGGSEQMLAEYGRIAAREGVADRVVFLGVRSDVPAILNAADAFVLPSAYEASALVGLEAMACGKPVLMTPVGGSGDYLDDGRNGFVITQEAGLIASRLERLAGDPGLCDSMGRAARDTAVTYSWDRIADRYLALIHEIWAEKQRRA